MSIFRLEVPLFQDQLERRATRYEHDRDKNKPDPWFFCIEAVLISPYAQKVAVMDIGISRVLILLQVANLSVLQVIVRAR